MVKNPWPYATVVDECCPLLHLSSINDDSNGALSTWRLSNAFLLSIAAADAMTIASWHIGALLSCHE